MALSQLRIPSRPSRSGIWRQHSKETVKLIAEIDSLQLQGELRAKQDTPKLYKGVFHGVSVILRNEGPRGLYRGIGAAVKQSVDCPLDTHV